MIMTKMVSATKMGSDIKMAMGDSSITIGMVIIINLKKDGNTIRKRRSRIGVRGKNKKTKNLERRKSKGSDRKSYTRGSKENCQNWC